MVWPPLPSGKQLTRKVWPPTVASTGTRPFFPNAALEAAGRFAKVQPFPSMGAHSSAVKVSGSLLAFPDLAALAEMAATTWSGGGERAVRGLVWAMRRGEAGSA